jgi:DNA-binding transcriptional regulator YiaG
VTDKLVEIGARLEKIRIDSGLKIHTAAKFLNVSVQLLAAWEKGRKKPGSHRAYRVMLAHIG